MNDFYNDIINNINISSVFFSEYNALEVYSSNIPTLWNIEKQLLDSNISITRLFEVLREKEIYPLKKDFRVFVANIHQILVNKDQVKQEHIIVDSLGNTFIESYMRTPNGLLITWQNINHLQKLKQDITQSSTIIKNLINHYTDPALIINPAGQIDYYSKSIANIASVSYLENIKIFFNRITNENEYRNILKYINIYKNFTYTLLYKQNKMIISGTPLLNGNMLLTFKLPNTLKIPKYKKTIKKYNNTLIKEVHNNITSNISSIYGNASLLKKNGSLNIKQEEIIENIHATITDIIESLNSKMKYIELQNTPIDHLSKVYLINIVEQIKSKLNNTITQKNLTINIQDESNSISLNKNLPLLHECLYMLIEDILIDSPNNSCVNITIYPSEIKIIDTSNKYFLAKRNILINYKKQLLVNLMKKLQIKILKNSNMKTTREILIIID